MIILISGLANITNKIKRELFAFRINKIMLKIISYNTETHCSEQSLSAVGPY